MITKLEQNRVEAGRLRWRPRDFGAAIDDFTPGLVSSIEAVQGILGVPVDGVAGPQTYSALLAARQTELLAGLSPGRFADAGLIALYELKIAWMRDGGIIDLPSPASGIYQHCVDFIDGIIRTTKGIDWDWEPPYVGNETGHGNFEWCGAAAAFAWKAAGMKMTYRRSFFSSPYRLDRYARYLPFEHTQNIRPPTGPYRVIIDLDERSTAASLGDFEPRAGDILLVGMCKSAYGTHVALVEGFDRARNMFLTIEGNGTGMGPNGVKRHGVVAGERPLGLRGGAPATTYHARRLIRVAPSDLIM